jgi:hypothetical protein
MPFPMTLSLYPTEISHAVFGASLIFALFDSARRAHLGRTSTKWMTSIMDVDVVSWLTGADAGTGHPAFYRFQR